MKRSDDLIKLGTEANTQKNTHTHVCTYEHTQPCTHTCTCMHVYVRTHITQTYVCTYMHTYPCTYTDHTNAHACIYMFTHTSHIHACVYTHMHMYACICTHITDTCMHLYAHTPITHTPVYALICTHTCMHIYVHTPMHTYITHTHVKQAQPELDSPCCLARSGGGSHRPSILAPRLSRLPTAPAQNHDQSANGAVSLMGCEASA